MEPTVSTFQITQPDPVDRVIFRVRINHPADRYAHELLQLRQAIAERRRDLLETEAGGVGEARLKGELDILRGWLRAGLDRGDWLRALGLTALRLTWQTGLPMRPEATWDDALTQALHTIDLYGEQQPLVPGTPVRLLRCRVQQATRAPDAWRIDRRRFMAAIGEEVERALVSHSDGRRVFLEGRSGPVHRTQCWPLGPRTRREARKAAEQEVNAMWARAHSWDQDLVVTDLIDEIRGLLVKREAVWGDPTDLVGHIGVV